MNQSRSKAQPIIEREVLEIPFRLDVTTYGFPKHLKALRDVWTEVVTARAKYHQFARAHEAYAVLLEEVEELWTEVRSKNDGSAKDREERMRKEAMQVAAMAICFMAEVKGSDV